MPGGSAICSWRSTVLKAAGERTSKSSGARQARLTCCTAVSVESWVKPARSVVQIEMPIRPRLRVTIRSHRPRSDHQAKRSTRCSFLRADGGWRWPTEFLPLLLQRDWRYFEPGIARAIYGANQLELAHLAHANVLGCARGSAHHLTVDIHQVCLHRYVKRELHLAGVLDLTKDFCAISLDQHT